MDDRQIVDRLLHIEGIEQLKARYFRLVDAKRWDEWRELFVDDLDVELPGFTRAGHACAADAFVAHARSRLEAVLTIHHGHLPELELTGPDTASGTWAMCDLIASGEDGTVRCGAGHYHEEYRRQDGEWRIAAWRLRRIEWRPVTPTMDEDRR